MLPFVIVPLFLKAMTDCSSSIQLLCDHGASVNARDMVSQFVCSHFNSCIVTHMFWNSLCLNLSLISLLLRTGGHRLFWPLRCAGRLFVSC